MAIKKFRPTSPGQRFKTQTTNDELTKGKKPEKRLTKGKKRV